MRGAAKDAGPDDENRTRLPWWKKTLFAFAVLFGCLASLEASLWLFGVETLLVKEDPYVGFADTLPLFVPRRDADGRLWMTTAENKLAWFNDQRFPRHKTPGTRRVFCLGGSTTYGHPYDDSTSFAAWMRELLPAAAPDTTWEVINAGGISYASYRVAVVMQELAAYEPDLFVVYTGNNEFLEQRTYGELRRLPPIVLRVSAALAHTRIFSAARRLVDRPSSSGEARDLLAAEVDAVLDHTVGPASYQRNDAQRQRILEHFEFNLARMAMLARDCGAELVLVVPAVNLRDCSPFKSDTASGLATEEIDSQQGRLQLVDRLQQQGRLEEALAVAEQAAAVDPRHAGTQFRIGQLLLALERPARASIAFQRAADEDVCTLRIPSDFQQAVRRAAVAQRVMLVDFDQRLKNQTLVRLGHNIPGDESFLDHVHLTIHGYRSLAAVILEQLAGQQLFTIGELDASDIQAATERIESRIDRRQHAVAERNLAKVLGWAGKHHQAGRLALQALQTLPEDPESLVIAGAYVRNQGDLLRGSEYLRRAVQQMPDYAEARLLYGAMLVDAERWDEARDQFQALVQLRSDDAAAWRMVGAILVRQQQPAEAQRYLLRSLQLADEAETRFQLALALQQLDQIQQAIEQLQQVLVQNPRDDQARRLLQKLGDASDPPTCQTPPTTGGNAPPMVTPFTLHAMPPNTTSFH